MLETKRNFNIENRNVRNCDDFLHILLGLQHFQDIQMRRKQLWPSGAGVGVKST